MHGCRWDSGAARERSSALAASVASRYALGADGVGAARPGARERPWNGAHGERLCCVLSADPAASVALASSHVSASLTFGNE